MLAWLCYLLVSTLPWGAAALGIVGGIVTWFAQMAVYRWIRNKSNR